MKNPIPIDPKIIPHIIVDGSIISPLSRQVDPIENTQSDIVSSVGLSAKKVKPSRRLSDADDVTIRIGC
jgi:hypothetical protein